MQEHQDKDQELSIYYSLNTARNIIMKKDIEEIYVLSFGKELDLPKKINHRHLHMPFDKFTSFQPFKLDTLLVSVKNGEVIDKYGTISDIGNKIIDTTVLAAELFCQKPYLITRLAALIAETLFIPTEKLFLAAEKFSSLLKNAEPVSLWKEFKRLLKAEHTSAGIEFLRLCGALKIILPELNACYGVEQNRAYHEYTVYEHCLRACDACNRSNILVKLSALIHDVGKPETVGINENGITFHKHEVVSSKMAHNITIRFGLPRHEAIQVENLVSVVRFIKKVGLSPDYIGRLSEFPLFQLRHADRIGRGLAPQTQKQDDFEARIEKMLAAMKNEDFFG